MLRIDHSIVYVIIAIYMGYMISLSIYRDRTSPAAQGFIHLKITHEKGGYVLGQFSAPFFSVSLCIAFYTQRELTIKHINHRRLGFPVGKIKSMQQQL